VQASGGRQPVEREVPLDGRLQVRVVILQEQRDVLRGILQSIRLAARGTGQDDPDDAGGLVGIETQVLASVVLLEDETVRPDPVAPDVVGLEEYRFPRGRPFKVACRDRSGFRPGSGFSRDQ